MQLKQFGENIYKESLNYLAGAAVLVFATC
jgi:hypothetical protein